MTVPFDDKTRVDRFDDETRVDREPQTGGRRLFAAVDGNVVDFPLPERPRLVIGRSPEIDLTLDHPSVSRQHSALRGGARLGVEDLGSSNGTWVRGERLAQGEVVPIRAGEVIRIGDVSVWVERKHGASPPPVTPAEETESGVPVVVEDQAMRALYGLVDRVAPGSIHVLLLGETGVGKEIVARAIHYRSARGPKPFVALNCAAFSEELLESELFGHERGAFTGAAKAKPGLLEQAQGGTILLDEIGELALSSQAKLLRALEEGKVLRLGSLTPRSIDVRFVAATNRDLQKEIEFGRFRQDLYYRLNGVTLEIPPLRDRRAEIQPLARRFVRVYSTKLGRVPPVLLPQALDLLERHRWPGNIRELRNVIQRAVLLCADAPIGTEHLLISEHETPTPAMGAEPPTDASPQHRRSHRSTDRLGSPPPADLKGELERVEKQKIVAALEACGGNQTRAARELGISRNTLLRKLDRYGVPRPRKRS